jgi:hypothetical protein
VGFGIPSLVRSGSSTWGGVVARLCEVSWELVDSLVSVCGPFAAQGAKGEEYYP